MIRLITRAMKTHATQTDATPLNAGAGLPANVSIQTPLGTTCRRRLRSGFRSIASRLAPTVAVLLAMPSLAAEHDSGMHMLDKAWFHQVKIDQLEFRDTDEGQPLVWDAQAWLGDDLNRLQLKTEGERLDGVTEEAELQALYSRAVSAFWNVQAGWRRDFQPHPQRDWLAIGVQGLAPYFFEVEATAFVGESGHAALRLEAEYELLLTQRLILTPEIEANLYSKDDPDVGLGSGLANIEAGLRLRYEIRREVAPYIGVVWTRQYGDTADFTRAEGGDPEQWQAVMGLRFWF